MLPPGRGQNVQRQPAKHKARRIRRHDGLQAQICDAVAIQRTCRRACAQAQHHRLSQLQSGRIARDSRNQHRVHQRHDSAHRQVDAATDNHKRLPHRQNHQRQKDAQIAIKYAHFKQVRLQRVIRRHRNDQQQQRQQIRMAAKRAAADWLWLMKMRSLAHLHAAAHAGSNELGMVELIACEFGADLAVVQHQHPIT